MRRSWSTILFPMPLIVVATLSVSCSNQGFSRSKAFELLNQSREITAPVVDIPVTREGFRAADKEGWWRKVTWEGQIQEAPARDYFSQYWYMAGTARLKTPIHKKVTEITGISESSGNKNEKEVEFRWEFSDVPDYVKKYAGLGHQGEGAALFKLYDDGWRVETVQFGPMN